jgi:hypothetical protein
MEIKRINWHPPLLIDRAILGILGLIVYAVRGFQPVLALPVLGAIISSSAYNLQA